MPGGRISMTNKSMIYSKTQLFKKYIQYYLKAGNSKGHGIHSPFVFDFIIHVLQDKKKISCLQAVGTTKRRASQK